MFKNILARLGSKKDKASLSPANKLEELLHAVQLDPARNEAFFTELAKTTVYVLGSKDKDPGTGSEQLMFRGTKVKGRTVIPVFSSLERLQKFVVKEEQYVKMPARQFFALVNKDYEVVMNPNSDIAKPFTREEIDRISGASDTQEEE